MKKTEKIERKHLIILVLIIIAIFLVELISARALLPRQMDDVRPGRYCSSDYIGKSDYLMVIPMFDNISIAENKTWCSQILALNKTLGMHGITHAPDEFSHDLNESYIIGGIEEFNKCFGKYPEIFTAPEFELSKSNAEFIKSRGIRINGWSFALTHKVYHCVDEGKTSYLEKVNRIVDIL